MDRRTFIRSTILTAASASLMPACQQQTAVQNGYNLARVDHPAELPLPAGKRVPFEWRAFAVPEPGENGPVLRWDIRPLEQPSRLRVTTAIDGREEKLVDVLLAESGDKIGELDLRFTPVLEPFEVLLSASRTRQVLEQGVRLSMRFGSSPVWFFKPSGDSREKQTLMPHLWIAKESDPLTAFHDRLASLNSIQPYGWMEGCVLDGLYDLWKSTGQDRYHAALETHLNHFFDDEQRVIYESPRSEPLDGIITGIESTLPNAVIAKLDPQHPVLDDVVAYWLNTRDSENSVQDGQTTSAEGSYTVGYPMMVIGQARGDQKLIQLAVQQLRIRKKRLIYDGDCWLRHHGDGTRTYQNWARGVAWYGLGLVRTLIQAGGVTGLDDLKQEVERLASWVQGYQQEDGLWRCFLHENVLSDTSGSAGIAAALALAIKYDLLSDSYSSVCQRTREGLISHLTPDGLLTGVAQSNRGGESLQRSDYRVISPMGMGLMAQLNSALR